MRGSAAAESRARAGGPGRLNRNRLLCLSVTLTLSLSLPLWSRRVAAGILFIRLRRMDGVTASAAMVGVAGCRT